MYWKSFSFHFYPSPGIITFRTFIRWRSYCCGVWGNLICICIFYDILWSFLFQWEYIPYPSFWSSALPHRDFMLSCNAVRSVICLAVAGAWEAQGCQGMWDCKTKEKEKIISQSYYHITWLSPSPELYDHKRKILMASSQIKSKVCLDSKVIKNRVVSFSAISQSCRMSAAVELTPNLMTHWCELHQHNSFSQP